MKPLDQYETPLTDAMESIYRYPEYHEGATKYVDREKCREVERRLAACREALEEMIRCHQIAHKQWRGFNMLNAGEKLAYEILRDAIIECEKTLTLTKP